MFRSGGAVSIGHTIFANNIANLYPDYRGVLTGTGYNLVENTSGVVFSGTTTGNITGLDPVLGPLAFNGGLVATHALLAGSPAIDAGNPSISGAPATDQRSAFLYGGIPVVFARIADGDGNGTVRIDIGAHERQPTIFGIISTSLASSSSGGVAFPNLLSDTAVESRLSPLDRASVFESVDRQWIDGSVSDVLVANSVRRKETSVMPYGRAMAASDSAITDFESFNQRGLNTRFKEMDSLLQTA